MATTMMTVRGLEIKMRWTKPGCGQRFKAEARGIKADQKQISSALG
jgi:hypothetical protein